MSKSPQEVKKAFMDRGISLREWAQNHGFSQALVYQVLSGKRKSLRGESYRIAVELGLKEEVPGGLEGLKDYLKGRKNK